MPIQIGGDEAMREQSRYVGLQEFCPVRIEERLVADYQG